ncbi:hypothetical protein A1A1_13682 [Planococcus antarcticus DSM 14505]|uniref:Uncharacterized protein n=1 Tax=Planococcus antarcticus DSM 14505 TaxID=1185653 RepID=A0AA87IJP1_9BACL|nr:hypothetical protein [Planococcus antarcticus]EIM05931.1 hypothetical protein A1A1_13682 [Planococcus antarcticus DSM 14505]
MSFLSGCNDFNADSSKSERDQQVLDNVWAFVEGTEMPKDEEWKKAWLNGEIEETEVTENITSYVDTAKKYHGQTVLLITPTFEAELVAYPRILVDPETREVIGYMPGE